MKSIRQLDPTQLNQPDAYYKALIKQMQQAYALVEVIFEEDGRPSDLYYLEANAAANDLAGTELMNKRHSEVYGADQQWYELFGRVAKTGISETCELPAEPHGAYYKLNVFQVGGSGEHEVALLYTDITGQKEPEAATEELRKSEEQLRYFVTASSSVVYKMSADWKEMFTLNGKNVLADTDLKTTNWVDKYIPKTDRALVWRTIDTAIATKSNFDLEHRVIQADGSVGWIHSRAVPVVDAEGHIREWIGAGNDITSRKHTEAELSDSEERFRTNLDITERVVAHLLAGEDDFEETLEIDVNGRIKVVRLKGTVTGDEEGEPVRVLGVDLDVTAMREASLMVKDLELRQRQEIFEATLAAQEEERRRISESLHNGLGQTLYGSRLAMDYLTLKLATENPDKFQESKIYAAKLITECIRETRRISHELMPTVLAEFGLKEAIKDICDKLFAGMQYTCRVSLTRDLENWVELAVFRTVQELAINVIKHAEATQVEVQVKVDPKGVLIMVSDNGRGMATAEGDQRGIGLSSIRSKVELLKGVVDIQSEPGKGTRVEVRLPHQARKKKTSDNDQNTFG